ncbi:MAG: 4Fe-4S dicluster domain-containing protein [Clostridia bacterium]|nr:4Fe-4S dicluster domain-containing protein [Clostridia bacterium]
MTEFLKLKKSNCRNCYKCIRSCPVKSIRFSGGQAHIVADDCILCGHCVVECPQDAKQIVSSVEAVKVMLKDTAPVIASVAPSFVANYDSVGIEKLREALKKLGFADAEETAIGATIVKNEYNRILKEGNRDIVISSCCHSINLLIQKYYPGALPYLADVVSPMVAHGQDLKRRIPGCKTVFIGPCVAKKDEAERSGGAIDAVLTFEELAQWFEAEGITVEKGKDGCEESKARLFPTTGGIIKTMENNPEYTYLAVDGVENCMAALEEIVNGTLYKCFIEMSACVGSCIGGPVMERMNRLPLKAHARVSAYTGKKDFEVIQPESAKLRASRLPENRTRRMPSEMEITEILRQMGKTKPEHELNCGSCGYNTCRDKAIAVYRGNADVSMCTPYLMSKAENFSDNILNNTPNAVIVLNEDYEVQQINRAALDLMNIRYASDVLGEQVVRIMDPQDFMNVRNTGRNIYGKKAYLAEYRKYVEETITYDREYRNIICFMRDVTSEESERSKKESISRQTVETANKVVEKQMRIVQEIASLLGETAAETKIALTKLKESIDNE